MLSTPAGVTCLAFLKNAPDHEKSSSAATNGSFRWSCFWRCTEKAILGGEVHFRGREAVPPSGKRANLPGNAAALSKKVLLDFEGKKLPEFCEHTIFSGQPQARMQNSGVKLAGWSRSQPNETGLLHTSRAWRLRGSDIIPVKKLKPLVFLVWRQIGLRHDPASGGGRTRLPDFRLTFPGSQPTFAPFFLDDFATLPAAMTVVTTVLRLILARRMRCPLPTSMARD
ncbi:MAG: hypothetical protein ONB48_05575 [candidate division KSB1 bacterium]|nr:hypothetical protein [candidate division KSB1 bacterium]MDZ7273017.1 hypothetical protein [candidate division KSB1 bacterium]MDZ7285120.1 hypothetical protein [candidate division KSB1 bacterium]MDZ7298152.1 hypothetical protein [candidate division KSB1 bacterium]MDZ7306906.1 hypothetical protein [candidate division KSB1 bacterium]